VITTYGRREFLGEMGLLTGQGVYVTADQPRAARCARLDGSAGRRAIRGM
jgi:hypothetical protein